ncbi:MAG: hypothetical protein FWH42_04420 [Dehalococcoidia bacterium]|nr:hypothetical protein [Dehalococcoidia bacterium]
MLSSRLRIPPVFGLSYIKGHEPFNIFTSSKNFVFTIYAQKKMVIDSYVYWKIKNYFQDDVATGIAVIPGGEFSVTVTIEPLEAGHYVVEAFTANEIVSDNFAVVIPYEKRPQYSNPNFDSPFGMDASILINNNWVKHADSGWQLIIHNFAWAVKLSGVTWVHQRMIWTNEGTLSWAKIPLDAFKENNLKVLQNVQFLQRAINEDKMAPEDKLPNNLRAAYNMAKYYGSIYSADKDQVHMWEPWNEPEASGFLFTGPGEGADRYAAVLKAMSIGFRDCGMSNPLVTMGGLLARDDRSYFTIRPYQDNLFDNEIMYYIDVYNFHNHLANVYRKAETDFTRENYKYYNSDYMLDLSKSISHLNKKKELELLYGVELPAWNTEAGGGIANSPQGLDSYDKQVSQARYLVTSIVRSLSTGVDKHFWFGGQPGASENNHPYRNLYWSCFNPTNPITKQITPYAAYAALSVITEVMGEAIYLGKILNLPINAEGYAFKNGSYTVLVLWAKKDVNVSLDLKKISGVSVDIMGRKKVASSVSGVFELHLSADPIYLKIEGAIPAQKFAASNYTRKLPRAKTLTAFQRVVLDQIFPVSSRSHDVKKAGGYIIQRNTPTLIEVTIYNFNENISISGTVTGSINTNNYSVSAPQNVMVAANSQKTLTFTVSPVGKSTGGIAKLSFIGVFDVGQTTPTVALFKVSES